MDIWDGLRTPNPPLLPEGQLDEFDSQVQLLRYPWGEVLRGLEEYWRRYRHLDEVEEILALDSRDRVLDVGCGVLSVLHLLDGERVGVDPLMEEYWSLFPLGNDVYWLVGAGEDLPFRSCSMDTAACTNVLDHVQNPGETLREIRRVLREGGELLLTVDVFGDRRSRIGAHPHTFVPRDVRELLEGNGFRPVYREYGPSASVGRFLSGHDPEEGIHSEIVVVAEKV